MPPQIRRAFDAEAFLNSPGVARRVAAYAPSAALFAQGDAANTVPYNHQGRVKLSVVSETGKEAVVGVLGPGDFLAKELAGQPVRLATDRRGADQVRFLEP